MQTINIQSATSQQPGHCDAPCKHAHLYEMHVNNERQCFASTTLLHAVTSHTTWFQATGYPLHLARNQFACHHVVWYESCLLTKHALFSLHSVSSGSVGSRTKAAASVVKSIAIRPSRPRVAMVRAFKVDEADKATEWKSFAKVYDYSNAANPVRHADSMLS